MPDHLQLATQFGQIYQSERQPEELQSPALSSQAQNLLSSSPATYGKILSYLLNGQSVANTAKKLKTDKDLVRFISRVHPEIRRASQSHTIANLEESLHHLSSRLANEIHQLPLRDVPKTISSTTEQLALLTGHATTRVEFTNTPSREKLLQLYNTLHLKDPK
jgi:hypothetical protein